MLLHGTITDPALTSLLQRYKHGLLDEIPLDEAAEILGVHGEVGQLEGADGHLQQMLAAAAIAGDVGTRQGHDGGAGVRDASGQALLWGKEGRAKWGRSSKSQLSRQHPTAAALAGEAAGALAPDTDLARRHPGAAAGAAPAAPAPAPGAGPRGPR